MTFEITGMGDEKLRLRDILLAHEDIAIAGHTNPDGDCIGSCFGLGLALKAAGKNVCVLLEDYKAKYECIPGGELVFKDDPNELKPELFIACDCADKKRLGHAVGLFEQAGVTLNIDHHATNDGFADVNIVDAEASSTCELICKMICGVLPMPCEVETALCAGILHDTGGLRYNSTSAETLRLVSAMRSRNVPFTQIINTMIFEHTLVESRVLAKVIGNMQMVKGYPIVISYINTKQMCEVGATVKDLDGISEYLAGIKEAQAAIFVYPRTDNEVKVSLRSKGIDVGKIAKQLGGGGHMLAAGLNRTGAISEAMELVLELLKREFK